jgi:hypothetical protein
MPRTPGRLFLDWRRLLAFFAFLFFVLRHLFLDFVIS